MAHAGVSPGDGPARSSGAWRAGRDPLSSHTSINWDAVSLGVDVVSGKWLLPVMAELVDGPKRHNQLSRAVQLDHKRLGRVLRRAQEAQIVTREADTSRPRFAVQYRLTGYGKDLVSILAALGSVSQDGEA